MVRLWSWNEYNSAYEPRGNIVAIKGGYIKSITVFSSQPVFRMWEYIVGLRIRIESCGGTLKNTFYGHLSAYPTNYDTKETNWMGKPRLGCDLYNVWLIEQIEWS